jgi:hypothetical protein
LAAFGIAPYLNYLAWYIGVMWVGSVAMLASTIFKLLAFDSAHKNMTDLTYGPTAIIAYPMDR